MNQVIKILSFIVLYGLSAMAELSGQSAKDGDYLILSIGDTLYGTVEHVDRRGLSPAYYKKIRVTNANGKRRKYKRSGIESFRVDGVRYQAFWLNQSSDKIVLLNPKYDIGPNRGEQYFLREISLGKLSHYQMEWWDQGDEGMNWMDLLIKEGDSYFIRATQGIFGLKRKTLSAYFENCPELAEKIEQKELKRVGEVVDLYNTICK
ncbi:MAG TPA: hypothetical protein VJ949_04030 [Cryomorphaceae bacterium]|nr:hypothetical protein [Cryomorphaceae bacterium]